MAGLTLDTGALIALERRRHRMRKVIDVATRDAVAITVPVVIVAEWWRGQSQLRELVRRMATIEWMHEELATAAGEALAQVKGVGAPFLRVAPCVKPACFRGLADDMLLG